MIWQDIVIAVISLLFGVMLFPQLRDVLKGGVVNVYTAGLTAFGLYLLGITFVTLQMWTTVVAEIFSGTVWFLLFFFSVINKRKKK
jgi:hypothetical protein